MVTGVQGEGIFYDYDPDQPAIVYLTMNNSTAHQRNSSEDNSYVLKSQWSSHEWIHTDLVFSKLVYELKLLRLSQVKLIGLLYGLTDEWNRLFVPLGLVKLELNPTFDSWHEVEKWLVQVRDLIRKALAKPAFSPR